MRQKQETGHKLSDQLAWREAREMRECPNKVEGRGHFPEVAWPLDMCHGRTENMNWKAQKEKGGDGNSRWWLLS